MRTITMLLATLVFCAGAAHAAGDGMVRLQSAHDVPTTA